MFNRDTANRLVYIHLAFCRRLFQFAMAAGILICLFIDTASAAQDQSGSGYLAPTISPMDAKNLHRIDGDRLNFASGNPFLHRLSSGLKFRGLKLSDNFYLTPKKHARDINDSLGISYADGGILYYFSPQLLSISFRY